MKLNLRERVINTLVVVGLFGAAASLQGAEHPIFVAIFNGDVAGVQQELANPELNFFETKDTVSGFTPVQYSVACRTYNGGNHTAEISRLVLNHTDAVTEQTPFARAVSLNDTEMLRLLAKEIQFVDFSQDKESNFFLSLFFMDSNQLPTEVKAAFEEGIAASDLGAAIEHGDVARVAELLVSPAYQHFSNADWCFTRICVSLIYDEHKAKNEMLRVAYNETLRQEESLNEIKKLLLQRMTVSEKTRTRFLLGMYINYTVECGTAFINCDNRPIDQIEALFIMTNEGKVVCSYLPGIQDPAIIHQEATKFMGGNPWRINKDLRFIDASL